MQYRGSMGGGVTTLRIAADYAQTMPSEGSYECPLVCKYMTMSFTCLTYSNLSISHSEINGIEKYYLFSHMSRGHILNK